MSLEIVTPYYLYLDIWIDAGHKGQIFTYKNSKILQISIGDLVKVSLREYPHSGIVVKGRNKIPKGLDDSSIKSIEELLEATTIDPNWYNWLHHTANQYHISFFKMLKIALPSGWIGNYKNNKKNRDHRQTEITLITRSPIKRSILLTNNQLELIHWLRGQINHYSTKDDLEENKFAQSTINSLEKKTIVQSRIKLTSELNCKPKHLRATFQSFIAPLHNDQQIALQVLDTLKTGSGILLWGVTGSGKTEVYIQAAAKQLQKGYNVLMLTPEISLIAQLVDRCRKCFGEQVIEYHSNSGKPNQGYAWGASYNSASNPIIVIGTRSAIFLPLNPLGLIILDEEHDNSYKQESPMPCYHARDLAIRRNQECSSKLILGSATPSLEAWRVCHSKDLLNLVRLRQRINGHLPPKINIVDMQLEVKEGHRNLLSRSLLHQLKVIKGLGEQAIILVPRRGYNSFLSCRSCGAVIECPKCDVPLRVHQNKKQYSWLHCHWCNYKDMIEQKCQDCGSHAFKAFGTGTQRVIEQLEQTLDGFNIIRFDHDTTRGKNRHRQILAQFASGKADILLGTQMLSKGIDLPRVTLAAILAADNLLRRPDLRSFERSLQLFLQLAGRAGRGDRPGQMFLQTYYPQHPVIRYLASGEYEEFLIKELSVRKASALVPYSRGCILHFSGVSDTITVATANLIAESIRLSYKKLGWKLIGPFPAPVGRISGRSQWQLLLYGEENNILPLMLSIVSTQMIPKGIRISIDPDPENL
uniref:DNA 3'-5' helicase n=1 Tax=Paulinella longichromatophora TaxID=1708747 RepID=A0A2H4ZQP0_9EUKA|nr:primosomal protein N' (replication factor Y) [Paulinella longichromatophora]